MLKYIIVVSVVCAVVADLEKSSGTNLTDFLGKDALLDEALQTFQHCHLDISQTGGPFWVGLQQLSFYRDIGTTQIPMAGRSCATTSECGLPIGDCNKRPFNSNYSRADPFCGSADPGYKGYEGRSEGHPLKQ